MREMCSTRGQASATGDTQFYMAFLLSVFALLQSAISLLVPSLYQSAYHEWIKTQQVGKSSAQKILPSFYHSPDLRSIYCLFSFGIYFFFSLFSFLSSVVHLGYLAGAVSLKIHKHMAHVFPGTFPWV